MNKILIHNKFLYLIFIGTVSLICSSASYSQATITSNSQIKWHQWSTETFALAKEQNKLVLLDISAPWCQFCKKMKAVTYQNPEVISIINEHYIAIHADIETNKDVQGLYGNLGVPGTVILSSKGGELNKRLGYIAPQQMQWHLLGNLQDAPSDNNISQN